MNDHQRKAEGRIFLQITGPIDKVEDVFDWLDVDVLYDERMDGLKVSLTWTSQTAHLVGQEERG